MSTRERQVASPAHKTRSGRSGHSAADQRVEAIARDIHQQLLRDGSEVSSTVAIRDRVERAAPLLSSDGVAQAVKAVTEQLFGFGPLESLLADPAVSEVMINGPGPVWVERNGTIERTSVEVDEDTVRVIIERIVGPLGLRVDRTAPFVDARLADGSRVNVAVPPLALDGPYVTIRRFRDEPIELGDFGRRDVTSLLVQAMRTRRNIVVSGGTGSGKTSLINALAAHIPSNERVITIEDAAELRLRGEHVVRLEARPANAEGIGAVPVRALVRNALRMRPDRIIVGEVRGIEAVDLIQAMNTGHEGSLSTCHANSAQDAVRRIESMALMDADAALPLEVVRAQLLSALHLVVHVVRLPSGARTIRDLYECGTGRWPVRNGSIAGAT